MIYEDAVMKFGKEEVDAALAIANKSRNKQAVTDGEKVLVTSSVGSLVADCYERILNAD